MLNIRKMNIVDENNNILSVIIDYKDYLDIEEIIENYGLATLIDEYNDAEYLSKEKAVKYYSKQKEKVIGN